MNARDKKYLFFDLDNTLTPSRQPMRADMAALLPTLGRTLVVVSGSENRQIRRQIGKLPFIRLGQNGNHALDQDGNLLWNDRLSEAEKAEVDAHIAIIRPALTHDVPDEDDLVEDRGSQISFSIYGHNASPEAKRACDGDFQKRRFLLEQYPFRSRSTEVQIGGSTCFDYFKKGRHKGSNIRRLIELNGWGPEACVYFGDALFPGGNDASVIGIIDTVPVTDEVDTYQKLLERFAIASGR